MSTKKKITFDGKQIKDTYRVFMKCLYYTRQIRTWRITISQKEKYIIPVSTRRFTDSSICEYCVIHP